jgi:hypothetical protein
MAKQFLNQQRNDHQTRGNVVKMTILQILKDIWVHGEVMLMRRE